MSPTLDPTDSWQPSDNPQAREVLHALRDLQESFASRLSQLGPGTEWQRFAWRRNHGRDGGGCRLSAAFTETLGRASINISQVHYSHNPEKPLACATALSTIIHPINPYAPSVHIHISQTQRRTEPAYWRLMADLNPSHPDDAAKNRFGQALADTAPELYTEASQQGDRYFYIPALKRTRGVTHFYLEGYRTDDFGRDLDFARRFGDAATGTYASLVATAFDRHQDWDEAAAERQLAYHTLYAFQVLTLDRGTIWGLLVHDDNDVGILGSLPAKVDRDLMASWRANLPPVQRSLLDLIVSCLPVSTPAPINDPQKRALAAAIRRFYAENPGATTYLARGDTAPPTLENHTGNLK